MKLGFLQSRQIEESKYLSQENTWRYRTIIRLMYKQYEKMQYWVFKEDVYEYLKQYEEFQNYTMELLKSDLNALVEWHNLTALADTTKVNSIEAFKNREFRYQLTPYTIEIERMLYTLEHMTMENHATLEASLVTRFHNLLATYQQMLEESPATVYSWWKELNGSFKELNQNYQDYISQFYSPKVEEMMKTTQFLLFKESFVSYLRNFIRGLQLAAIDIGRLLESIGIEDREQLLEKVLSREKTIGNMTLELDEVDYMEMNRGRFESMDHWFLPYQAKLPLVDKLIESTNEIIRKITRYATQIAERQNSSANRKEEYRHIAKMFGKCRDQDEAAKLSAVVLGTMGTMHFVGIDERETESINSSMFEEAPTWIETRPRVRTYREKIPKNPIVDKSELKLQKREALLKQRKKEEQELSRFISSGEIDFKHMGEIQAKERKLLLKWLTKGKANKGSWQKTEIGKLFKVEIVDPNEKVVVVCEDGSFTMPYYRILFKDGE
ncbi:MAG: TIGR02677 family protein [Cellulosilyticaceae bacterium]